MIKKVDQSIRTLSEHTEKATVYMNSLLQTIGQIKETLLTDYLGRRIEVSNAREHFRPLFMIRDFLNEKYGSSDSSRHYAKLLRDRGIPTGAQRVGSSSHVGFYLVFVESSEEERFNEMLNQYLNK